MKVVEDTTSDVFKFLNTLGFPISVIALAGAFSVGAAIWRGEISRQSKPLLLGVFLIAVSAVFWYTPKIYRRVMWDGERWRWGFSFWSLVGVFISGVIAFYSGKWFWALF